MSFVNKYYLITLFKALVPIRSFSPQMEILVPEVGGIKCEFRAQTPCSSLCSLGEISENPLSEIRKRGFHHFKNNNIDIVFCNYLQQRYKYCIFFTVDEKLV